MRLAKYQALGNDYLVIEPGELPPTPGEAQICRICDRHKGIGADGILLGPLPSERADFGLRIYNPDGSLAEISGNGLRIFARYLWDEGRVAQKEGGSPVFSLETGGRVVQAQVLNAGNLIVIEMGQASFDSRVIPVSGPPRQVLDERWEFGCEAQFSETLRCCAVSLGNPHCVVLCEQPTPALAQRLGPLIENDPRFPRRTNVQFLEVLDRSNLRIEIWERGAGYTLASGSSSCAAAAAAYQLGLCEAQVQVHMPGGQLQVRINPDLSVQLAGPAECAYRGEIELC